MGPLSFSTHQHQLERVVDVGLYSQSLLLSGSVVNPENLYFFLSSPVMLMLQGQGTHFENHWSIS